jgi:hypothetical protein
LYAFLTVLPAGRFRIPARAGLTLGAANDRQSIVMPAQAGIQ